jgi:DNA-binding transcriptional LysR family regulator
MESLHDLNRLAAFVAVAECAGFTAAATRLGTSKARVSLDVQRLERTLGVALFTRTTRKVRLTDAGQQLLDEAGPLLAGLQDAVARTSRTGGEVGGTLRISTSVDHAAQHVAPLLPSFAALHPGLRIHLLASDHVTDMLAEGIDLSFRMGWLRDSSLRAIKLGEFEQHVVAAPAYLLQAGRVPGKPEDLADHAWIALSLLPTPLTWQFTAGSGQSHTQRMNARLQTDSATALRSMLLHGAGVSVMDGLSVQADLADGRLVRLLADWRLPTVGMYAVHPPGRHVSPAARAFIEFFRAHWAD